MNYIEFSDITNQKIKEHGVSAVQIYIDKANQYLDDYMSQYNIDNSMIKLPVSNAVKELLKLHVTVHFAQDRITDPNDVYSTLYMANKDDLKWQTQRLNKMLILDGPTATSNKFGMGKSRR